MDHATALTELKPDHQTLHLELQIEMSHPPAEQQTLCLRHYLDTKDMSSCPLPRQSVAQIQDNPTLSNLQFP
jgi:hypothetical protein